MTLYRSLTRRDPMLMHAPSPVSGGSAYAGSTKTPTSPFTRAGSWALHLKGGVVDTEALCPNVSRDMAKSPGPPKRAVYDVNTMAEHREPLATAFAFHDGTVDTCHNSATHLPAAFTTRPRLS